jgi:hypothetical protein
VPTTHINREVGIEEIQRSLANTLGTGYHITRQGADPSALKVTHNLLRATVRARPENNGTTLEIVGSGFILLRIANTLLITRKITNALDRGFA